MSNADTAIAVRAIIAKQLRRHIDDVIDAATFPGLGADSLDAVEIEIACEDTFGIALPDGAIFDAHTIGNAIAAVERALAGRIAA